MAMLDEGPVFVRLSSAGTQLEWRSLALVRNKPKAQGQIPVASLESVSEQAGRRIQIRWTVQASTFRSSSGRTIALELDSEEEFGRWLESLRALLEVWKPTILLDERRASSRQAHRAAREQELQERRRQREEKKRELGLDQIGMSQTAQIMANR